MITKSEVRETLFAIDQTRRRLFQPRFTELGLTLGQGQPRILNNLLRKEDVSQKELALACRLEPTTLSRTLDHMENAGLITRQRDPNSRRAYHIRLTGKGRDTALQVRGIFDKMDDVIWDKFSAGEMEALLEGLKRIQNNLSSIEEL